jgi:ubiquinone biosynthesis protein
VPQTPERPAARKRPGPNAALRLLGLGRRYQRAARLRQILTVFVRYGFGELVSRLEIDRVFHVSRRLFSRKEPGRTVAELNAGQRLTRAFEELGPTFIKLGQVLSTRPDIMPPEYLAALSTLQDNVPGFTYEEVAEVILSELKAPPEQAFAEFTPEPLAAASLAQVHRARLATGEEVAVKVQRPGIEEVIAGDLDILETIARLVERRLPHLAAYDPVGLVQEFGRSLRLELDFNHEGQNCDISRANFKHDANIVIPRVFWTHTSQRVLTLEMIRGTKINDGPALDQAGLNRPRLAVVGCEAYMRMIFDYGFFQADPHPGNLLVLPDGRIAILDYGMFSRISEQDRHRLVDLLLAAYDRRADLIVVLMKEIGLAGPKVNDEALTNDVQDLLDRYYGLELKRISMGRIVQEMLSIIRHHRIHIPHGFTMLLRGLATIEGLGMLIDPDFNFVESMRPFLEHEGRKRFGIVSWLRNLRRSSADFELMFHNLPSDLRSMFERIKKGQIELVLNPDEFRKIGASLERSNNRLSVAIILAAIILGSSLMVVFVAPKGLLAFVPILGVLGFLAAGIIGVWLLFTVLRGERF